MEIIEKAVIHLIRKERFYAEMLFRMKRIYTKDSQIVPTIGVSINNLGLTLWINEYFAKDQTIEGLAEILKHECEHPMRGHFEREKSLEPDIDRTTAPKGESIVESLLKADKATLLNQAEDYSINQDLNQEKFPKKFRVFDSKGESLKDKQGQDLWLSPCLLEKLKEQIPNKKIEENQAMEYYYGLLKEDYENNGGIKKNKDGTYNCSIDAHSLLEKSLEEMDSAFAKAIVQKIVNESHDALSSSEAGNIPGHLKLLIDKLNKASKDWRKELRIFGASCSSVLQEETKNKRNRRYGLLYPGKRSTDITHIAVAVDSSGSTSEGWTQFFSEITALNKTGTKITFIECDCQIQAVKDYNENYKPELLGGGGTMFKPVFDLVSSKDFIRNWGKIDGLIYFTDGENFQEELQKPNYKVLWALMPNCKVKYDWGKQIHIELTKGS